MRVPLLKILHEKADSARQTRPLARPTLIRRATVWTAAGQILEWTDVLLHQGRIAGIGRDLQAPAGALVIRAQGKHLTPGIIDPHSHLGIFASPDLAGHNDGNEIGRVITPAHRVVDGLWPQDPGISRALAAGVTTVQTLPGSANLIGGLGMVIKLVPGQSARDLQFPGARPSLKLACGENPKRIYLGKNGPFTRMGNVARVRAMFHRAVIYRQAWKRWRAQAKVWLERRQKLCAGKSLPWHQQPAPLPPKAPKYDPALEVLAGVLAGRVDVHWHCYRASEMMARMTLARQFGFRIAAFHHATEAYKIRRILRRHGTSAVTWVNWWGFKAEALDAIPEGAALLLAAGVPAALHSDSPQVIQRMHHEAALAYYRGRDLGLKLTRDDALKLITLNPARLLGIDKQTGSIQSGKMADLTLWDGNPFSVYTRAEKVFVDGRLVYDRHRPKGRVLTDFELGAVPQPAPIKAAGKPAATRRAGASPRRAARPWARPAARPRRAPTRGLQRGITLAVTGGRIHAVDGSTPRRATVLLRGDRIVAVGPGLAVPRGARVIDARGALVTPGFIAAGTALGLVEILLEKSANDASTKAARQAARPALRSWDGLNLDSVTIPVTRMEGFTSTILRPIGGLVSGQAAHFDLAGRTPARARLRAPVALYANLGLAGARAAGSRNLAFMRLRGLLSDARLYRRHRQAIEARRFRRLAAPVSDLAALVPVLERKLPLVVKVNRASDILAVLRFAREEKIRLVLTGAAEAWRVARAIARDRVVVLVNVDRNVPDTYDALAARFDNAARLHAAGVTVGLTAAGDAHNVRFLRQSAGIAVAWGLPHAAALAALTRVPAQAFGLKDLGVLAPGKRANLVVWTGDPFELSTRVKHLVIGGRQIPLVSRQTLLRDRYR